MKTEYVKKPRTEIIEELIARDGTLCQYPGDEHPLDFEAKSGPTEVTIDHHIPQHYGKANGWTIDEIWDLSNLRLYCKKHNAKKGDLIPNEDGTLPEKKVRTWKNRRAKRSQRPEICEACSAGRNLGENEWCNACGAGPASEWWKQKWRQMSVKECDHDLFYCVSCTIWFPEQRRSALSTLITGGEGYE